MGGTIDLGTTNWLLGVVAVASAIQALFILGAAIFGYRAYRQFSRELAEFEIRHLAPLRSRVDQILTDVHAVTARVSQQTERVDHAINGTFDRVDETAERVKHSVRDKVSRATGVMRGVRAVIASLLTDDADEKPRAEASGRV